MNALLYGHNPEEHVVAIQQLNDQTIRLFTRIEGKVLHKDVEFFPFFFLSDDSLLKEFPKKFWLKELTGNNYYRFIAAFTRWNEMWEAIGFILRVYNKTRALNISSYQELEELYIRNNPIRQFLLQSGITFFKGMEFNQIVRVFLDITTTKSLIKKSTGKKAQEKILVISVLTNEGKKYSISTHRQDEKKALLKFINIINEIDPDIIEGFDLFGTILPALNRASERQQIPLAIGRSENVLRTPSGFNPVGFIDSEWSSYEVFGRNLVDTRSLVESALEIKKSEQTIGLFSSAKHFEIPLDLNKIQNASHISELWRDHTNSVKELSIYRTEITQKLSDLLLPFWFNLIQICPLNLRMLVHSGAPARIESLMLRAYIQNKHSLPKPSEGSKSVALSSDIFYTGVFSNVLYLEVEGLFITLIQKEAIKPRTDSLNIFQQLISELSAKLNSNKTTQSSSTYNSMIASKIKSIKSLIDSLHIYLGYSKGLFNDLEQAEYLAVKSREVLKDILHQLELFNANVIHTDGHALFITAPNNITGATNEENFINRISSSLPDGVKLVLSQRYKNMLSYRKNNYALLDYNDNLIIKGNNLISRGMEKFLRVFIQRFIECLLTNDLKRLHHAYATAYTQIVKHQWSPLDFCRVEITKCNTNTYIDEKKKESNSSSPALEAAIRSSIYVEANTKISYYITGTEKDPIISNYSKLIEEWDPNHPDENTSFYLTRLHEATHKFKEYFEPTAFERIFSLDEMFGFSEEGINILSRKTTPELTEIKPTTEDYSIWLAETD